MAKTNGTALQKVVVSSDDMVSRRDLSHQMLGAAKYANFLHQQTGSDLLRFLIAVRDEKRFLDFDCLKFDDFLNSGHSPVSRTTFYRQLELFKTEGERYDLMEEWRVPARVRRLLTDGDFALDGKEVVIGGQRVPMGEETVIRQAFERLVKERIDDRKKIERLTETESKYQKLKAETDKEAEKPPYQVAYMQAVEAFVTLIAEVKDLPGELKAERAEGDLDHISELLEQLYRAYGEMKPYPYSRKHEDRTPVDKTLPYFQSDAIDGDNF